MFCFEFVDVFDLQNCLNLLVFLKIGHADGFSSSFVMIVRLTPQLHKEIAEYAALCGLTTSAYARKRLEGKYPKQRLTDKEMEALNSLSDARGDIQKLFGFLKGRPLTERENILRSEIFMKRWRTSAEVILNRMIEIEKYLRTYDIYDSKSKGDKSWRKCHTLLSRQGQGRDCKDQSLARWYFPNGNVGKNACLAEEVWRKVEPLSSAQT